ncbi:MAG: GDP-mannose 4,6-dehydratase [Planctomycetes bacterium]|nr:GDP-mannose 4,6-dehydratase [Planctomycetota bacterium]
MPTALITGTTGQDGSYLAELLLAKGYEVHGIIRRSSSFNTGRIDHIYRDVHDADARLRLHHGDLGDGTSLRRVVTKAQPDEIYNLGAQSHVRVSFDQPEFTADVGGLGALRILECIRDVNPQTRFYQASSSEMFGNACRVAINEDTPFDPRSPYAAAKLFAYHVTRNYREAYGLFAANGILFNHESPRRGETFVTRKVTRAAARIKVGLERELYLGNLDAKRDWGFAGDYVRAMWLMLQQDEPEDFVIGTGETHSVRELCELAFGLLDLDYRDFVRIDQRYYRPTEVDHLLADPRKAREKLGWRPEVRFEKLIEMMVAADVELAERELRAAGKPTGVSAAYSAPVAALAQVVPRPC